LNQALKKLNTTKYDAITFKTIGPNKHGITGAFSDTYQTYIQFDSIHTKPTFYQGRSFGEKTGLTPIWSKDRTWARVDINPGRGVKLYLITGKKRSIIK